MLKIYILISLGVVHGNKYWVNNLENKLNLGSTLPRRQHVHNQKGLLSGAFHAIDQTQNDCLGAINSSLLNLRALPRSNGESSK